MPPARRRDAAAPRHRHRHGQRRHRRAARRRRLRRRGQQHPRQHLARTSGCSCRRCGARPGPASSRCAISRRRRSAPLAAFGRMARGVAGQGLGDRPLGADGPRARSAVPDVPARLSARGDRGVRARASAADDGQHGRRRAPRSSTSSAPSTCATGRRSSTRRPTACSRSRRTRTSIPIAGAVPDLRDRLRARRARAWASAASSRGRSSACRARSSGPPNRRDFALDAARARRCSIALTAAGVAGASRSARSRICSPAAASTHAMHDRQRRRRHGRRSRRMLDGADRGLIFANLVDFDTLYGHRNDVAGYAAQPRALRRAPRASCCRGSRPDDLLIVTADHGNDPTTPSTDHSREHVPVLVVGARRRAPAPISAIAADVRRSGPDARRGLRRRPARPRHELPRARSLLTAPDRAMYAFASSSKQREREILAPQAAKSARQPGPRCGRRPRIRSGRRSSAIAIASSTARRSAG